MKKYLMWVVIGAEVLLIGGKLWEPAANIIFPGAPEESFRAFVKYQFILLATLIPATTLAIVEASKEHFEKIAAGIDKILKTLKSPRLEVLSQDEFYQEFRKQVTKAKSIVDISHLDTFPPGSEALRNSESETYYNNFVSMVKNNHNVEFRRVERFSTEKIPWIRKLIDGLSDERNFSLHCLALTMSERKLPYMSVQIIDKRISFIVAVAKHTDAHYPRDILMEGGDISEMWLKYYNSMLWEPSIPIIEHGKFYKDSWDKLTGAKSAEKN